MRLIDADAAVEVLQNTARNYKGLGLELDAEVYEEVVWKMRNPIYFPTIDVAPVVHARWVEVGRITAMMTWRLRCSRCGTPQDYRHHYCPGCGAKMDGGAEDGNA